MMEYTQEQKELLVKIYDETMNNQKALKAILGEDNKNVNTTIYGLDVITSDKENLVKKLENFYDDLYGIQKHKFRFQISSLVLFVVISILGVAGYWIRREYIPWIASILLLLLAAPVFVMAGLETTYTFLSIDFLQYCW